MLEDAVFYFTYVLLSMKDNEFYTGYTEDLEKRLSSHNKGEVVSTRYRIPLKLIYFEACLNKGDALKREKYLKSTYGKRDLRSRLKQYLADLPLIHETEV